MLKEPLEQAGAQVYEVDGMADRSYHRDDVKVLKELIRRIKPDLVHTHGALSAASPPRASMYLWCTAGTLPSRSRPR